jgi:hypothetical protein
MRLTRNCDKNKLEILSGQIKEWNIKTNANVLTRPCVFSFRFKKKDVAFKKKMIRRMTFAGFLAFRQRPGCLSWLQLATCLPAGKDFRSREDK